METKIAALPPRFLMTDLKVLLCSFYHTSNALGAQSLLHLPAIHQNTHLLQIGLVGAVCGTQGEAAIVAKGCRFSTLFTLCHFKGSFLDHDCLRAVNTAHTRTTVNDFTITRIFFQE